MRKHPFRIPDEAGVNLTFDLGRRREGKKMANLTFDKEITVLLH
jgi:hypothetical protein